MGLSRTLPSEEILEKGGWVKMPTMILAVLVSLLATSLCFIAGLLAGILHRADGASFSTAVRAGGRAALTLCIALAAIAGVAIAAVGS